MQDERRVVRGWFLCHTQEMADAATRLSLEFSGYVPPEGWRVGDHVRVMSPELAEAARVPRPLKISG